MRFPLLFAFLYSLYADWRFLRIKQHILFEKFAGIVFFLHLHHQSTTIKPNLKMEVISNNEFVPADDNLAGQT